MLAVFKAHQSGDWSDPHFFSALLESEVRLACRGTRAFHDSTATVTTQIDQIEGLSLWENHS